MMDNVQKVSNCKNQTDLILSADNKQMYQNWYAM
jgi:hypothetical protein